MKHRRSIVGIILCVLCGSLACSREAVQRTQHSEPRATIELRDGDVVRRMVVRVGPYDLEAGAAHSRKPDEFIVIPFDGWLLSFQPNLVNQSGHALPHHLVHHINLFNTSRRDFVCPSNEEFIFAAGSEMADWPALPGVGYRVAKGDRIRIAVMFHNPTNTAYPGTVLEVGIAYRAAGDQPSLRNIYPAWFYIDQCGHTRFDLDPGINVRTSQARIRYSGQLLAVGGHLHDYGVQLKLENLTRKEDIATLISRRDHQGHLLSLPIVRFGDEPGYRLNRGDEIRLVATYENPSGQLLANAGMAMAVGYFLPDDDRELAILRRYLNLAPP